MKTIAITQIKLIQSKYGNFLYFILFYQLGKDVYYFSGLFAYAIIARHGIDLGYLTQSVYEQLVTHVTQT